MSPTFRVILFLPLVALVAKCQAEDSISVKEIEFFETNIRPLLVKRCYSCHSIQSGNSEGDLLLDNRKGWKKGGENGTAIVPGNVDGSLLIQAVRYKNPDLEMPPDHPLSEKAIALLERWIKMGAPDPRDGSETLKGNNPSDPVAGRSHWAFQPLKVSVTPSVNATAWPRSEIDSFVLRMLESKDLKPAPDADRRALIRRLYFQLTGLPPTPEQMNTFLSDVRPDAYDRLVDDLIDSPRFGEQWGRHWLDLARYADSNGLDENFLFREAWRYRNWVISAVNADVPLDEFLIQQIAGDLLPYESIKQRDNQRIATGFMVLGPKVLLGNNPNNQRMEIADEQLDTIGKSILGMTLGCARCHDHKFDPIPTKDYYALAGILTSTKVMEQRYMLGQQRVMEQLVGLGEEENTADEAYEKYWRGRSNLQQQLDRAKQALKLLEDENEDELAKLAEKHKDAVNDVTANSDLELEQRIESQTSLVTKLDKLIKSPPPIPPRAMMISEGKTKNEHVRIAGEFNQLGDEVPRGFLQVLYDEEVQIPNEQSGRLQFSKWLTNTDSGAGRLAARVLANRVWHHLIGVGIVRTTDNFGRTGEAPSHPELLDYLASELIKSNWSLKDLVRKVAKSRTFRMSSQHHATGHAIDPENRLLWRAHRRRLSPESFRDALLSAAGTLDLKPMDSTVSYLGDQATAVGANTNRRRTDFPCRSVYLPVIRNDLPELFDVFDFADPHAATGMRPQTMVPTQGLFILNDELVMTAAEAIAKKIIANIPADNAASRVDELYELLLNVSPSDRERLDILKLVDEISRQANEQGNENAELQSWAVVCHAIIASSRFQILE